MRSWQDAFLQQALHVVHLLVQQRQNLRESVREVRRQVGHDAAHAG